MFIATIHVPARWRGLIATYDGEPAIFDTAREAWEYLAWERAREEDSWPGDEDPSETYGALAWAAQTWGPGEVWGTSASNSNVTYVYSVAEAEDESD